MFRLKYLIILLLLIAIVAMAEANPIPIPLPANMPLEDMYAFIEEKNVEEPCEETDAEEPCDEINAKKLRETFTGDYYFQYIPKDVYIMKYPLPPKSEGIGVAMAKLPEDWVFNPADLPSLHLSKPPMLLLYWYYIRELYPTILPEWPGIPMIAWNGPFPEEALFTVKYQHDLLRRGKEYVYFYALGTGKYCPTYQKEAISFLDISMPLKYSMYRLFLDKTPHAFAVTREKDELGGDRRIVSIYASAYFGPFKKDIIGFIHSILESPMVISDQPPQIRLFYNVNRCGTDILPEKRPNIYASGRRIIVTDRIVFNCCPEYIRMTIVVGDNHVIFREKAMEEAPCNCICFNDMKGAAGPFAPGTYYAELIDPYGRTILGKWVVIDDNKYLSCEGDFDCDGDVDGSDLSRFAADFGRTECDGYCYGDFDNDNDVDGSDLASFAVNFGSVNCPTVSE